MVSVGGISGGASWAGLVIRNSMSVGLILDDVCGCGGRDLCLRWLDLVGNL